ncbi:MAG: hypothetical protein EOP84_24015, partial [Verrucomicrobiaceae bacterium]
PEEMPLREVDQAVEGFIQEAVTSRPDLAAARARAEATRQRVTELRSAYFPTIGLSVLNAPTGCKDDYLNPFSKKRERVCGTVFKGSFENPEAISTVDPTDVRLGLSMTPRFSSKLAARIALDLHHLPVTIGDNHYGLDGIAPLKQLHAGIEFFVGNPLERSPFTVAMGLSQGFFTFGATVEVGVVSLEFSTYGRDISATDSPKEDRRMLAGLSMEF